MDSLPLEIDPQLITVAAMFLAGVFLLWFGKIVAKTAAIVIGICLGLGAVGLFVMFVSNGSITLPF